MESELLMLASLAYFAAFATALFAVGRGGSPSPWTVRTLTLAIGLNAASIVDRWLRLGHGPYLTLYETLTSNLLSLSALYALAWWLVPTIRGAAAPTLSVPAVLAAWVFIVDPAPGHLPPTYATVLLHLHVVAGKLFLAPLLVASGLSASLLMRRLGVRLPTLPGDPVLVALIWRFLVVSLVFDSAMLALGALWAQDAWGAYWSWDPIETWSLVTWIGLAQTLHLRAESLRHPVLLALLAVGLFIVAFLTFFGVPFLSTAQHQGAL